jgi:hypothetical protein
VESKLGSALRRQDQPLQAADPVSAARDFPALDPSSLLSSFQFEIIGEIRYLERDCVRVKTDRILNREPLIDSLFWSIPQHFELRVDAERGVLLGYDAFKDESVVASLTVQSIYFDDQINDSMFICATK